MITFWIQNAMWIHQVIRHFNIRLIVSISNVYFIHYNLIALSLL